MDHLKTLSAGRRASRWGLVAVLVLLALAVLPGHARADSTPRQALSYVDPLVEQARASLQLDRQALDITHQLDATVTATPNVALNDNLTDTNPPAWKVTGSVTTNVGYSYDRVNQVNELNSVARDEYTIKRTLRRGIFNALYTQAQMLQYQVYVRQVEAQVASAQNDVDSVQQRVDAGKARPIDLQQRKLRLQSLQLRLEQYRQQLQDLQDQAATYGLGHPAAFAPLAFELPQGAASSTSNYRLKQLNVQRQQANLTQQTVYDTLQYLELNGTYATGDVSVNTNLGIIDTKPRVEANVTYPGGTDRWSVGVSATIALSTDLEKTPIYQQRIAQARADLASYVKEFPAEAKKRLTNARFAAKSLALAEQQLALAKQSLASAQSDVDKLKQALQSAASQKDTADLQKQIEQALRTLQRAQGDDLNNQRNLYNAWSSYVRNVYYYLDYIDAPWKVASK